MKLAGYCGLFILVDHAHGTGVNIKLWPLPRSFPVAPDAPSCIISEYFRYEVSADTPSSIHTENLNLAVNYRNNQLGAVLGFKRNSHTTHNVADLSPDSNTCSPNTCTLHVDSAISGISNDVSTESYSINFDGSRHCSITCKTVYGCMHGMVTFTQLIDPTLQYRIPRSFTLADQPAHAHRGILIDTSRHFLSEKVILEHLELMAEVKMNVLHWHIVDDHSFPLKMEGFEEMSQEGAYSPKAVYTEECIRRVSDYAGMLGIRVVPEVDMPGHTSSWFKSHPELVGISDGAIDPTRDDNYVFIQNFLARLKTVFSAGNRVSNEPLVVHLGADETWKAWDTEAIRKWMKEHHIADKSGLLTYWVKKIHAIAKALEIHVILWEDFIADLTPENLKEVSGSITWQFWMSKDIVKINSMTDGPNPLITKPILYSSAYYLDSLGQTWDEFYTFPLPRHLLGGEACMWGEWVDDTNVISRTWPRAAALAERLWIGGEAGGTPGTAVMRLAKWRCRMVEFFGHNRVEPVGPPKVDNPETPWMWHTDKNQWWCAESDL
jgi:hexosaminidase